MSEPDLAVSLTGRLQRSSFATHLGFQLESVSPGEVLVRLPFREELTTVRSALHGGAIGSLIEAAGSLSAWSLADGSTSGRTISCDVSYLAGALGEDIFGEARVVRRGKELVHSAVTVRNGAGKQLAQGMHIFRLEPPGE